jgi:uncharacterized membrane-anchored protein
MDRKKWFILIGVFWLIIIIGLIGIKEFTLRTGTEILLKTVPVDPRDLFRGDYVILAYDIGRLDLNTIPTDYVDFRFHDKIYVSLKQQDGYGAASRIYRSLPKDEKLFLKGTVRNVRGKLLTVAYGIESYFVPEGKGKDIERAREGFSRKRLSVKVSIDRFGNAVIKSLLIDDKEVVF